MRRVSRWIRYFGLAIAATMLYASIANPLAHSLAPSTRRNTPATGAIAALQVTIPRGTAEPNPGDPADIYLPTRPADTQGQALPIALMLPGALVHRSYYSQFASAVARHGFAVVVPTHERSFPDYGISGELAEAAQIPTTLAFLEQENANPTSPLYRTLDPSRMALLGHSHGAAVGLQAIANTCIVPFCSPPFSRPDAVVAGAFYGVNTRDPSTDTYSPTANDHIPVAMVQGSLDGVATPDEAIATYNLIETPPKALITIAGSNHYGITNVNNPTGAFPDPSSPTLEQSQAVAAIAQWTGYFLRAHLYHDRDACQRIYGSDRPHSSVRITSILE